MSRPAFRVSINGDDITALIQDRLLALRVVDHAGQESDSVELAIDDRGAMVPMPPEGAEIQVAMGYSDRGRKPIDLGTFVVDEVELSSGPRTMVVKGSAARASATLLKELRTESYHDTTLEEIIDTTAQRNGLRFDFRGPDVKIRHEDQTNESDQSFLTRLAVKYQATIKPIDTTLTSVPRGSGELGGDFTIKQNEVSSWRARFKDRARYSAVEARYVDRKLNQEKTVTAEGSSSGHPTYQLKDLYRDEDEAKKATASKLQGLTAGVVAISLEMEGRPEISAEGTITLEGFRPEVDDTWNVKTVSHEMTKSGGFVTRVECGTPGDEVSSFETPGASGTASGRPAVAMATASGTYRQGNIGPTSTAPHFHIEQVGGGFYGRNDLDRYVAVNGQPLSRATTVTSEIGAPRSYGGHSGRDYAGPGGSTLTLTNGATWVGVTPGTGVGDRARFRLPNGQEYEIIHGTLQR